MYHNRKITDILDELKTSEHGLSAAEAKKRNEKYGKNILPKKKKDSIIKIFFNELKDPIVLLLIVAVIVSFVVGEVVDALVIIFIIMVDAVMGAYQENRANKTADALDKLVEVDVNVIRDGQKVSIPAEELTVGDYVLLESGDKISADLRLVKVHNFMVDESILTGESVQIEKSTDLVTKDNAAISAQTNMAFSGTAVVSGRAEAIVVKIGLDTELGKIADSLATTEEEKSPLTIRIEKFSRQISILVLVVALAIVILLIVQGSSPDTLLLTVIAFAVSALPEGLPLALTMALTIASNKMAKKNVIVRKLKSAESLGSCTVIASDKTGTLTVNEQTAKKIVLPDDTEYDIEGTGYELKGSVTSHNGGDLERAKEIALYGVLNNEASINKKEMTGDSIDLAFLVLGEKLNIKTSSIRIVETIPYESENKYSAVFYEKDGETYCTVKGSLEVVCGFCGKNTNTKKLNQQNETLAANGYRVIALANGKFQGKKPKEFTPADIKNLTFAGMVAFIDPIRKEAVTSIKHCHEAGIKVMMITGDHPLTALSIAKDLGLVKDSDGVASGADVEAASKRGKKYFDAFIAEKTVFARVAPLQKLEIVESLKRQGEFVAVTGDGVNDAPALKAANIGVAMGSGTDIARETADMIIADDNFRSIVLGIKEGRVAYANIRKIIFFLISCGLAEAVFFFLSIACGLDAPLLAVQLLWLNVVTDGVQDFALSFESAERDILKEPPRSPEESIFDKTLIRKILFSGAVIGLLVFAVWYYLVAITGMEVALARGYIVCLMTFMQNVHVFSCRSEHQSAFKVPFKNNRMVVFGVIAVILLQIIVSEVDFLAAFLKTSPIPPVQMVILFGVALIALVAVEIYKAFERKKLAKSKK